MFALGGRLVSVRVADCGERRGPAAEAQRLYEETEASRAARERHAEEMRLIRPVFDDGGGRPTKRDRRRFEKARRR